MGLFCMGSEKMEVIQCGKIQFSCQNLLFFFFFAKIALRNDKFFLNARKILLFLCKILYKTGKRGVIKCGLRGQGSNGGRIGVKKGGPMTGS